MHWDTFKQDNYSTVRGDGGSRVGEVRAGTTSPMPEFPSTRMRVYFTIKTSTHYLTRLIVNIEKKKIKQIVSAVFFL